jgi:hypothetical protein
VRQDIVFLASNSLYNLGGQKRSCPCYNPKNFEQIHWRKLFCRMYGLAVILSISTWTTMCLINKIKCPSYQYFRQILFLFCPKDNIGRSILSRLNHESLEFSNSRIPYTLRLSRLYIMHISLSFEAILFVDIELREHTSESILPKCKLNFNKSCFKTPKFLASNFAPCFISYRSTDLSLLKGFWKFLNFEHDCNFPLSRLSRVILTVLD